MLRYKAIIAINLGIVKLPDRFKGKTLNQVIELVKIEYFLQIATKAT